MWIKLKDTNVNINTANLSKIFIDGLDIIGVTNAATAPLYVIHSELTVPLIQIAFNQLTDIIDAQLVSDFLV